MKASGLQYLHLPMTLSRLRLEQLDVFRRRLGELPGPIFVHCRTGKRSGALAVMDKAIRDSMTGLQAVKKVHILGSPCDASLEKLIRNYVDSRRNQT